MKFFIGNTMMMLFLSVSLSHSMDIIVPKEETMQELLAQIPQYAFNTRITIPREKAQKDAEFFNTCMAICKENAESVLEIHKEMFEDKRQRLSAVEKSWLTHYAFESTRKSYKVEVNDNAVYRKMCILRLTGPEAIGHTLYFWQRLVDKKKIPQEIFYKQVEQICRLSLFFGQLEKEGIILRSSCVFPEIADFKAAL